MMCAANDNDPTITLPLFLRQRFGTRWYTAPRPKPVTMAHRVYISPQRYGAAVDDHARLNGISLR